MDHMVRGPFVYTSDQDGSLGEWFTVYAVAQNGRRSDNSIIVYTGARDKPRGKTVRESLCTRALRTNHVVYTPHQSSGRTMW